MAALHAGRVEHGAAWLYSQGFKADMAHSRGAPVPTYSCAHGAAVRKTLNNAARFLANQSCMAPIVSISSWHSVQLLT